MAVINMYPNLVSGTNLKNYHHYSDGTKNIVIGVIPSSEVVDTNFTISGTSLFVSSGKNINIYAKKTSEAWSAKVSLGSATVQADGSWETTEAQIPSASFSADDELDVRAEYGTTYSSEESMTVESGTVTTALQITNASDATTKGDTYCFAPKIIGENIIFSGDTTSSKIKIGSTSYSTGSTAGSRRSFIISITKTHTINWIRFFDSYYQASIRQECQNFWVQNGDNIAVLDVPFYTSTTVKNIKISDGTDVSSVALTQESSSACGFGIGLYNNKLYVAGLIYSSSKFRIRYWELATDLSSQTKNLTTTIQTAYPFLTAWMHENIIYFKATYGLNSDSGNLLTIDVDSDTLAVKNITSNGQPNYTNFPAFSSSRFLQFKTLSSTTSLVMRSDDFATEHYAQSKNNLGFCYYDGVDFKIFYNDGSKFILEKISDSDTYSKTDIATITPDSVTALETAKSGVTEDDDNYYICGALKGNMESGFTSGDNTKYDGFIKIVEK